MRNGQQEKAGRQWRNGRRGPVGQSGHGGMGRVTMLRLRMGNQKAFNASTTTQRSQLDYHDGHETRARTNLMVSQGLAWVYPR